ncbi:MAG TPA: hypothetical protein VHO91_24080, partial [Rhodopila sp.]|nr:hypothetical protein [Rhodopila sp.]
LLQPTLDPNSGWRMPQAIIAENLSWTILIVWSRPNWRQGSNADRCPITLLSAGGTPLLQVDSAGGTNRLVLFPGTGQVVASTTIARRHTHSIILRYTPAAGADMWLDQAQVATSVQPSSTSFAGQTLLLHDGTPLGAAQCWLHEAAVWNTALANTDVTSVLDYVTRWLRGSRKGIYLIFNGQSNAINYAEADGAAALLARGVAWHLGALACNVLATTT